MTIPGDPSRGPLDFPPIPSLTNIDFSRNVDFRTIGVTKDQVTSVVAESVQMQITEPSTQDFRFLEDVQMVVRGAGQEAVIGRKSSVGRLNLPAPGPTLALEPTGAQLKPEISAVSTTILVRGSGTMPPLDVSITVTIEMQCELP